MKKIFLPLLTIVIMFSACKKDYLVTGNESISLTVEKSDSGMHFTWSKPNTDTFLRYELYASAEPLPTYEKLGNNRYDLICTHRSLDSIGFDDIGFRTIGKKYYRVYAFLGNGVLSSPNVENALGGFILEENEINADTRFIKFEELNRVYILNKVSNGTKVTILDYVKNEVILKDKFLYSAYPQDLRRGLLKVFNVPSPVLYHTGGPNPVYDIKMLDPITSSFASHRGNDFILVNDYSIYLYPDNNNVKRLVIRNIVTVQNDYWGTYRFDHDFLASRSNPSYFINTTFGSVDSIDVYHFGNGQTINKIVTHAPNPAINLSTPILSNNEYICLPTGKILDKDFNVLEEYNVGNTAGVVTQDMDETGNNYMHMVTKNLNGDSSQQIKIFQEGNSNSIKYVEQEKSYITFIDNEYVYTIRSFKNDEESSFFYLEKKSFK